MYKRIVLVGVVLLSTILAIYGFDDYQVGAYLDDARYIVLAESLAAGQGYYLINFPLAPSEPNFPPGWPLLLATVMAFNDGSYTIFKCLSFGFWFCSLILIYRVFSRRISSPYLEVLFAFVALNPTVIRLSGMVMSEAAYLCLSLLTIDLFDRWEKQQRFNHHQWSTHLLLVVVAIVAVYTQLIRTVGLSIVLAVGLYLLYLKKIKAFGIFAVVTCLSFVPQILLNINNHGTLIAPGYKVQVLDSVSPITKLLQMMKNLQAYSDTMIASTIVPIFGPTIEAFLNEKGLGVVLPICNWLVIGAISVGLLRALKELRVESIYVSIYFVAVLNFWNPAVGSAQTRFLIPIIPFLFYLALCTMIWFAQQIIRNNKQKVAYVVTVLICPLILLSIIRNIQALEDPVRNRMKDLSIGTTWVQENTAENAIIMTSDPISDYLYTRRLTVEYPLVEQDIEESLSEQQVDYIIIAPQLQMLRTTQLDPFVESVLLPVLTSDPAMYRLVYHNKMHNVFVYKLR